MGVIRNSLIVIVVGSVALWLGTASVSVPVAAAPSRPAAKPPTQNDRSVTAHRFVGSVGCAAANCHGGNRAPGLALKGRNGSYNSAQVWFQQDPHRNAFRTLQSPVSRRIAERLHATDGQGADATRRRDCLACHATTTSTNNALNNARFSLSEGVGCEACHGPAEHWIHDHAYNKDGWAASKEGLSATELFAATGFRQTKDLAVRARLCADCHVGGRGRDMHHDMIAAGHPRLTFEFSGYHKRLSPHWDEERDRANYRLGTARDSKPAFEAAAYIIGQRTSAQAGLELLASRATDTNPRWPEFSEYDCASCHHALEPDRTSRFASRSAVGRMRWGNWLTSMVESEALRPWVGPLQLDQLRKRLSEDPGSADEVRELAGAIAEQLSRQTAASLQLDETQIRQLYASVLRNGQRTPQLDADHARQNYLAAVALQIAVSELSSGGGALVDPRLEEIRQNLLSNSHPDRIAERYRELASEVIR